MKTHLIKQGSYLSQIDNQRGNSVTVDLPVASGGTTQGPTAFELLAMSLNGCIATIFTTMAEKKRLTIEHLEIDLEAKTTDGEMEAIDYTLRVKTTATDQELEKCLELTEKVCPVGRLFHRAGVPFTHRIERM